MTAPNQHTKAILKHINNKQTGTTGMGDSIYSNLNEQDINLIISKTAEYCISKIQNSINKAGDEWDVEPLVQQALDDLKTSLVQPEQIHKKTKKP